jgi:preprotein translocase subunit SecE
MATEAKKGRKKESSNFLTGILTYFGEVRTEINKVSWPSYDDVRRLTVVVLIVTIVTSLLLGALSLILGQIINDWGTQYPIILAVLFVIITGATLWSFSRDGSSSKTGY